MKENTLVKQAQAFQRIHPMEYMKKFLSHQFRPDARAFDQTRDCSITLASISTSESSAVVRLGSTLVVCGIKAEIAEPTFTHPNLGYIVPNVEMGPLCSIKAKPGPPGEIAMSYAEILNKLLNRLDIFDRSSLCIVEGSAVWCLYIDVVCIADDGNVLDASILAAINALKNVKLPLAELDEEAGIVKADQEKVTKLPSPADLYPLSFALLEDKVVLSDPTADEEDLTQSTFTLVLNGVDGDLVYTNKQGPITLSSEQIGKCVELCRARATQFQALERAALP